MLYPVRKKRPAISTAKKLNSCPRGTYSFLSFLVLALLDKTVSLISISLILSLACTFRVLVFPNIGQQLQKREIE